MKVKKLILIIFAVFISLLFINSVLALEKVEWYETGQDDNTYPRTSDDRWVAQTFTVGTVGNNNNYNITQISVYMYKYEGGSVDYVWRILRTNATKNPINDEICSVTTPTSTFNKDGWNWYNISITGACPIEAGKTYALAVSTETGSDSNRAFWGRDTSGTYSGGDLHISWNSGNTWKRYSGQDLLFIIWGTAGADFVINLISPPDDTAFTSTTINFTASYVVPSYYNLTSTTYYIWNSTNIFNATTMEISGTVNSTTLTVSGFTEGDYKWNVYVCYENDTDSNCSWSESNYTFSVLPALLIDLISPTDDTTITTQSIIFNASLSGTVNLRNASLYIQNSTGIFTINTTSVLGFSDTVSWNITDFSPGNYEWGIKACGISTSGTLCNWSESNYTFSVEAKILGITYNSTAYETASESFVINIESLQGFAPTDAVLVYDGVEYDAEIENIWGREYRISKTIDIPTGTGDKEFYFRWNLGSYVQYTSNYTQTINPILFGLCNSSLTTPYLNISFKDEKDLTSINGTIDFDVYYYLGSGTTYKTLHYTNNTENQNYAFCFSPDDKLVNVNGTIIFSSSNYWERRINFDEIYTSSTTQKTLYLLSYDDGSWARFQVLSSSTAEALSGVTVTFYRDFGSGDEIIVRTQTDDVGMSASWIDPDYTYLITFEKEGYVTGSYNMQISDSNVRYIYLAAAVGVEGGWNYTNISSFSYQTYPPATINLIPNQIYTFGIYLVSEGDNLNVSMDLYCNDTLIYSDYDVNNVVNLSYNFNVSNCYQIKTVYTVSTSNGEDSITLLSFYSVYNILVGDLSLYSFLTAFDDYDFGVIGRWFKFVIALFIVITVAGVFYKLGGIDSLDSAITSIVAILVVIWIFSYVGWLSLGATWIAKYSIALLTSILGGVFIIWKLTAS